MLNPHRKRWCNFNKEFRVSTYKYVPVYETIPQTIYMAN